MSDVSDPITLTLPEAARQVPMSETSARELARRGLFPGAFQLGRKWLVHRQVFLEGLERLARGHSVAVSDPDALLRRALADLEWEDRPVT